MIKVGIVGGTGYTGVELLRLLAQHPHAQLVTITSRKETGMPVADMFPSLRGRVEPGVFATRPTRRSTRCDVVFFATPHGVAMAQARELLAAGVKVIDLAADFRLKDTAEFERWYKMPHACPEVLAEAVYGLPEVNREAIRKRAGDRPAGLLSDFGATRPAAGARSGCRRGGRRRPGRARQPDRGLQVGRIGRRPQGRGGHAAGRGGRQLQGVCGDRPPASAGDPSGARGDRRQAGEAGVHAASGADGARHLLDPVCPVDAGRSRRSTCRRCTSGVSPASPSST